MIRAAVLTAATLAAMAAAGPAAAEIAPGHWQSVPGSSGAYLAALRAFLTANPVAAYLAAVGAAAAFATWAGR